MHTKKCKQLTRNGREAVSRSLKAINALFRYRHVSPALKHGICTFETESEILKITCSSRYRRNKDRPCSRQ